MTVWTTHALQPSCAAVGLPVKVQGFHPAHVWVKVSCGAVWSIDPEVSISTAMRFLIGCAVARDDVRRSATERTRRWRGRRVLPRRVSADVNF